MDIICTCHTQYTHICNLVNGGMCKEHHIQWFCFHLTKYLQFHIVFCIMSVRPLSLVCLMSFGLFASLNVQSVSLVIWDGHFINCSGRNRIVFALQMAMNKDTHTHTGIHIAYVGMCIIVCTTWNPDPWPLLQGPVAAAQGAQPVRLPPPAGLLCGPVPREGPLAHWAGHYVAAQVRRLLLYTPFGSLTYVD